MFSAVALAKVKPPPAPKLPLGPPPKCHTKACKAESLEACKALYENYKKEAKALSDDGGDPVANASTVNKNITKEYSDMYSRRPDMQWTGAAAFVSKQMGCNMRQAQDVMGKTNIPIVGSKDMAEASVKTLVRGNQAIFNDIYPQYKLFESNPNCILQFGDDLKISPDMKRGFRAYNNGNGFGAMMEHADYEQNVILEEVFSKYPADTAAFQNALDWNDYPVFGSIGKGLGYGVKPQVSFEAGCVASNPANMFDDISGKFTNMSDRWDLAQDTLGKYQDLLASDPAAIANSVKEIGTSMSGTVSGLPRY